MNFDKVLALGITILFISLLAGAFLHNEPGRKCTNEQLHQVIALVEKCKKQNVVCSSENKEKIIFKVCNG